MKNNTKIIIGVLVAVVIAIGATLGASYNKIASLETDVETQFANIESKLQRRYDLIPNLVSTLKGAMQHEEDVFTAIADARAAMSGANTVNGKIEASNQMESALSRLMVVSERYPEISTNKQTQSLMDELSGTENRISVERDRFNQLVGEYNKTIRRFPTNLVAGMFGFEKISAFEAVKGAETAPTVDFSK